MRPLAPAYPLFRLALLARAIAAPLLVGGNLLAAPLALAEVSQRYDIAAGPPERSPGRLRCARRHHPAYRARHGR